MLATSSHLSEPERTVFGTHENQISMNQIVSTFPAFRQPTDTDSRVLLLDDNAELADTIRAYLALESFAVTVVPNGAEGLKAIMRSDFDVIVCDLLMPHLPGDKFYLA